jgi:hypothetical protein
MNITVCPGCGAELPAHDGPVHRYIESSASCWAKYGDLLAREYQDPAYMSAHRLTVDTYAVQHPGTPSARAIRSVAAHLISLHAVLELALGSHEATSLIKVCVDRGRFTWLSPPQGAYRLNVLHPLAATTAAEHVAAVREWAEGTWEAWAQHHGQVRAWAALYRT